MILRIGARCQSQYEFSQHAIIARRSDITDDEIEATKQPIDARRLERRRTPHCSTPPTSCTTTPGSATTTWQTLPRGSPTEQLLDVIFTVGNYHLVSIALNSCGVQLDDGVPAAL